MILHTSQDKELITKALWTREVYRQRKEYSQGYILKPILANELEMPEEDER